MERTVQRSIWEELKLKGKLIVLEYARECGNKVKACREFEVLKFYSLPMEKKHMPEKKRLG